MSRLGILSIGERDLKNPKGGDAWMVFSSLVSLAILGHSVYYLHISPVTTGSEVVMQQLNVTTLKPNPCIKLIKAKKFGKLRSFLRNWKKEIEPLCEELGLDVILAENREAWYPSYAVKRVMHLPLILRINQIRGMYWRRIFSCTHDGRELLRAPLSIFHNALLASLSNHCITLTYTEEWGLRKVGVRRISTIEPTFIQGSFGTSESKSLPKIEQPYILFLGNFTGWDLIQNAIAFRTLKSSVSKLTNVKFVLVGSSIDEARGVLTGLGLLNAPNILCIKALDETERCRLFEGASLVVIPLPWITGVSMRLVESLARGKAVLCTSVVARKLRGLLHGEHLLIEDNFHTYPSLIRDVITNDSLRNRLELGARRFFNNTLSPMKHGCRLRKLLQDTVSYNKDVIYTNA